MGVVTVTVTYECSLDSDDLVGMYRDKYGAHPRYTISDKAVRRLVKEYPAWQFVSDFTDDDVPKVVVSR